MMPTRNFHPLDSLRNNVIPEWFLSSKLEAFKVFAFQMQPQAVFGVGCLLPQNSGNLGQSFPDDYATPTLAFPHQGGGDFSLGLMSFLLLNFL
jgi:hypothetical protein